MKIKNLLFAAMAMFAFAACTDTPDSPYDFPTQGGNGGTTEEGVYINETFATSFGVFTPVQTVGNYPWVIDYSTAKATSYADGNNNAATSWLISSPVDFTEETGAYIAFEYIIRYAESGKVADNHQLLICSDFSGDVATASWTNIPYGAVEGADWTTFYKANVAVPAEFLGKSAVTFALRYTATTKAGTWEVKNFVVAHGAATGETPEQPEDPDTPDTPEVPAGENLLANGGFEEWSGNAAVAWAGPAGHNATVSQSTDARTGNYSIAVAGAATGNKRLASQSYVLAAGTYTFSVYVKANGAEAGLCRIGYVPIENGQAVSSKYTYETASASAAPAEWTPRVFEFTLTEQTEVAFVVMNNKAGNGASFLVDDASLTTADGSISGGDDNGEDNEEPETPAGTSSIADVLAAGAGSAKVQGTVIATYARGFIVNDGTASILVYLGGDQGYVKGDVVTVEGTTSMYGGLLQFGNTSTVTKTGTATVNEENATSWTGADLDAYLSAPSIKYVEYTGTLTISGYYYNVTVDGASTAIGSISYPADGLVDAALDGQKITVKGYAIGVSGSKYVNTMATSVEAAN